MRGMDRAECGARSKTKAVPPLIHRCGVPLPPGEGYSFFLRAATIFFTLRASARSRLQPMATIRRTLS